MIDLTMFRVEIFHCKTNEISRAQIKTLKLSEELTSVQMKNITSFHRGSQCTSIPY